MPVDTANYYDMYMGPANEHSNNLGEMQHDHFLMQAEHQGPHVSVGGSSGQINHPIAQQQVPDLTMQRGSHSMMLPQTQFFDSVHQVPGGAGTPGHPQL